MERKKQKFHWVRLVLCFLILALLSAGAAAWFLFGVNRFFLSVELAGEEELILDYGEAFADPGARAILSGSHLLRQGREAGEVHLLRAPDCYRLGKQSICYEASFRGMTARAERQVRVVDRVPPEITLKTDPGKKDESGRYVEEGYTAFDNVDGDLTDKVVRMESLGKVTYAVLDSSGNLTLAERKIPEYDFAGPEITLAGGDVIRHQLGRPFRDPGFEAVDNVDGDVTALVTVEGEADPYHAGSYPIRYHVRDSFGNETEKERLVEIAAAPRPEVRWPQGKVICLTFDDGPGPDTLELLDVLDKYGAKATFFVTDSGYEEAMGEIVRRGHSIGIHTVSHNYAEIYAGPEAYFQDLYAMQDIIREATGVTTTLMRFPGGSSNAVSIRTCQGLMTYLVEAVQDAGFQYFDWNVDSDDAGATKDTQGVLENIQAGVREHSFSIVLQHDIHPYSVAAVEEVLRWGQENGYRFEALTETSPGCHHGLNN